MCVQVLQSVFRCVYVLVREKFCVCADVPIAMLDPQRRGDGMGREEEI